MCTKHAYLRSEQSQAVLRFSHTRARPENVHARDNGCIVAPPYARAGRRGFLSAGASQLMYVRAGTNLIAKFDFAFNGHCQVTTWRVVTLRFSPF